MTLIKRRDISRCLVCLSACILSIRVSAQVHEPAQRSNKWLILAEEQYLQSQYALSARSARTYLDLDRDNTDKLTIDDLDKGRYYYAASLLKTDVPSGPDTAIAFINTTAGPAWKQRVAFSLAQYYFRHAQYARALPYYELAGTDNLNKDEQVVQNFELAYCYFNLKKFDKAEPLFAAIKELKGKYFSAGNYYYGLLAYNQSSYNEALQSFERVKDEPQYRNIVPYYIAEIYYFTGKKDKALEEAVKLTNRPEKLFYDNELHLLAAQCLFEAQRYEDALAYFEYYYEHTDKIRKEDLYEMGYSYYKVSEWTHAIERLKPLSNAHDSLGQTAMYLLGDCYIKAGDKKSARIAFGFCADMAYNPGQQEAALILNAKLSYEMGYNDEAQARLNTLLETYPSTSFRDEAKTMISDLLLKSNNFTEAFKNLQEVSSRDANYWPVQQKVTYGYAMQQFQAGNITEADSLLTQSLKQPKDKYYEAAACFWKGEIAYRQQRFADVLSYTKRYFNITVNFIGEGRVVYVSPPATFQHAYLNMGYASMQVNDYGSAQYYFNKAQQGLNIDSASVRAAILHEADAVFMQKNYAQATALYDRIIATQGADADYAIFQKAIILGLQDKQHDKAALLQSLINRTTPSKYAGSARYELALAYIEDNKYQQAIAMLTPLTQSAERNLAPKAWMKLGFAHQQMNNDGKAIEAYKHIITEYPSSEERIAALDALKSLYIESNQPGAYAQLLKDNNLPSADNNTLDSTYYAAAEASFASGKWDKSKASFDQYLQQFPNGAFTTKAYYYRGESNYQLKDYKSALSDYAAVLAKPFSDFSENSARRAATISFTDNDYTKSLEYYQQLRSMALGKDNLMLAYNGLMKSSYSLQKYNESANYADTLLGMADVDENTRTDASFYKAKSLQHFGKPDDALNIYKQLEAAKNGAIAAEARYRIAEIYLEKNMLKDAEAAADKARRTSGGYDYWVVKSNILLADVLVKQKDLFSAKGLLQGIVKNTKIPELKEEAGKKLDALKAQEKKQSKLSED